MRTSIGLALLVLGIAPGNAFGQNLVPSPGFEEHGDCTLGAGWSILNVWETPDCALGPPYFNACDQTGWGHGVPSNDYGYQNPHGGDGYCCLVPYLDNGWMIVGNPQAYLSTDLLDPLETGEEYCISFWLSLADSSAFKTSELHAFLWYGLPSVCNYNDTAWDSFAAVTFDISDVDSMGWHLVQGSFSASGGELNLTLGSFLFEDEIDTTLLVWHTYPPNQAMYFIDDVYLGDCAYAGVAEEPTLHDLSAFPNPASDHVRIELERPVKDGRLEILDMYGRVVEVSRMNGSWLNLDVSSLNAGAYLVRLTVGRERLMTTFTVDRQ